MATTKEVMDELLVEARKRQRKKTDLLDFEPQIKEMMQLNISLPIILGWLEKEDKKTTLPALRRYVKKVFGEDHYEDFTRRNGWKKIKVDKEEQEPPPAAPVGGQLDREKPGAAPGTTPAAPEKKNDNPLIAMGIGTSLQKVSSEPKVTLTFNKKNQEGKL